MKSMARVIDTELTNDGKLIATIQFNRKMPHKGDTVTVKWGKARTKDQNSLYWKWLTWLVDEGGLKEQGYVTPEELHEALKGRLLCRKVEAKGGFKTISVKSTTELKSNEFAEYMDKAEMILAEYCQVDSKPFWQEYSDVYSKY